LKPDKNVQSNNFGFVFELYFMEHILNT